MCKGIGKAARLHMDIAFLLNGETVELSVSDPTLTLLDWLREDRGLKGTKEGCNEGDCGACTVIVTDDRGRRAVNACILFVPQLHGKAVRTVEGVAGPDGQMHPVQQAMIEHHGSQCGFCTPGFVTSMAAAHAEGATDFDDRLAGNLCRCTGYAPIIRAAEAASGDPVPDWMEENLPQLSAHAGSDIADAFRPQSKEALALWLKDHPDATLIAGATDVGLWVTKSLRDLGPVAFLNGVDDMKDIEVTSRGMRVGAMATVAELRDAVADTYPSFAELLRRFASEQIRGAATVGGNIANGSPIGDIPPVLIALGASLHIGKYGDSRVMAMESFFVEYGKQDIEPGEFVEEITVPAQPDRLKCYKLSKRFDQDISAVCGAFNVLVNDGVVKNARIAFGGMAGIPKRATNVEQGLIGNPWTENTIGDVWDDWARDFTPMTDMRASADYRLDAARNMLTRYFLEDIGAQVNVLEVGA